MSVSFPFDPDFQKHVLASFLESNLAEGCECLKEEYFDDELLGDLADLIREFQETHKETPTKEALIHELKERGAKPGRKLTEYYELIEDVFDRIGHNGAYYRGKAQGFAQARKLEAAFREGHRLLLAGDYEAAFKEAKDCVRQNGHHGGNIISFLTGLPGRALGYVEERQGKKDEKRIKTGFPLLDERISGGLGSGESGVILAPPGHGKSTALISFASYALLDRKKVLYVTLELSGKLIAKKFECNLFGSPFDIIRTKTKTFLDAMERLFSDIVEEHLHIAEFPTKSLTVYKLEELIVKMEPEIVFVDYAQIMRPVKGKDDRRHEITDIHEGLRGVAGSCHIPIWTAHQANRPSLSRKEIGMENIAEDFNVAAIADVVISLNQTEDEKRQGKLKMHFAKNRLGETGDSIECNVNWRMSKIYPAVEDKNLDSDR